MPSTGNTKNAVVGCAFAIAMSVQPHRPNKPPQKCVLEGLVCVVSVCKVRVYEGLLWLTSRA